MLVGSNTLDLNEATMIQALQYYFDQVLFKDNITIIVAGVKPLQEAGSWAFRLSLTDKVKS